MHDLISSGDKFPQLLNILPNIPSFFLDNHSQKQVGHNATTNVNCRGMTVSMMLKEVSRVIWVSPLPLRWFKLSMYELGVLCSSAGN